MRAVLHDPNKFYSWEIEAAKNGSSLVQESPLDSPESMFVFRSLVSKHSSRERERGSSMARPREHRWWLISLEAANSILNYPNGKNASRDPEKIEIFFK